MEKMKKKSHGYCVRLLIISYVFIILFLFGRLFLLVDRSDDAADSCDQSAKNRSFKRLIERSAQEKTCDCTGKHNQNRKSGCHMHYCAL